MLAEPPLFCPPAARRASQWPLPHTSPDWLIVSFQMMPGHLSSSARSVEQSGSSEMVSMTETYSLMAGWVPWPSSDF